MAVCITRQPEPSLSHLPSHSRTNAMSGKHLRGVDNSTLRRRILRAERDILPKMLRGFEPRRRGGAMHAIHVPDPDPAPQPPLHGPRPVSEAQTLIGAQLPLLPDHPAASWLSTSWTVPGYYPAPSFVPAPPAQGNYPAPSFVPAPPQVIGLTDTLGVNGDTDPATLHMLLN